MKKGLKPLPDELRTFIGKEKWTFAKTMPLWPHEYIVRERVDEKLFVKLVRHIRKNGFEGRFYQMKLIYFEEDGKIYWTMGNPIKDTTIINRCRKEDSYESRLKNGTLPKSDPKEGQLIRVVVQDKTNGPNRPIWVSKEEFQRMLSVHPEQKSFNLRYPVGYFGFTHDMEPRQTLTDEENLAYPSMSLEELRSFVAGHEWRFAKTMPFLPHYYVIDAKARDLREFKRFIAHIRRVGVARPFYYRQILYLDLDGWKYWTMGYPIDPPPGVEEEGIINRALLSDTKGE